MVAKQSTKKSISQATSGSQSVAKKAGRPKKGAAKKSEPEEKKVPLTYEEKVAHMARIRDMRDPNKVRA